MREQSGEVKIACILEAIIPKRTPKTKAAKIPKRTQKLREQSGEVKIARILEATITKRTPKNGS